MLTRRDLMKLALGSAAVLPAAKSLAQADGKPNIIFVTVDDLNSSISPLSPDQGVVTPTSSD